MNIVEPPQEMFANEKRTHTGTTMRQRMVLYITQRILLPPDGGVYREYKGTKYPEKSLPFPQAVSINDMVKRILLMFTQSLIPTRWSPTGFLENFLDNLNRLMSIYFVPVYLKDDRYCSFSRELRKFITIFLTELGINPDVAAHTGKNVAHILEFDSAYRYMAQDMLNEIDFKHPRKDILKLIRILNERSFSPLIINKFSKYLKLLYWGLLIPKINKAFKKAVKETNIKKLGLDEIDYYYCLLRADWKFFGRTYEDREKEWYAIHPNGIPPQVTIN